MNTSWMAALPALALSLTLASDAPGRHAVPGQPTTPHLGAAIAEQRNLVAARPGEAGVWNDLGNLLALSGSLDEAQGAYERALELDPGSVRALFNLGLLRQQRGDLTGAVSEYTGLLQLEPGHAWGHYQLGAAYDTLGERELALAHYAEAFTLDPELLFAEKNPHVIENELATEALLRARRGSRAAPPAPRAYDEPARINSILTPALTPADLGRPEPVPSDAPADDEPGTKSAPRDQIGRGAAPRTRSGEHDADLSTDPQNRVLDSGDLRASSRSNQVRGNAEDGGAAGAANSRRRSAATVMPQSRGRSVEQPPAGRAAPFGIGQRSTGSLEWKLEPASDEPVPAR